MIKLVVLVLMLSPDSGAWRVAEVALPPGTPLSVCQGAAARVAAMSAAEQATRWFAWDSKCIVREQS